MVIGFFASLLKLSSYPIGEGFYSYPCSATNALAVVIPCARLIASALFCLLFTLSCISCTVY